MEEEEDTTIFLLDSDVRPPPRTLPQPPPHSPPSAATPPRGAALTCSPQEEDAASEEEAEEGVYEVEQILEMRFLGALTEYLVRRRPPHPSTFMQNDSCMKQPPPLYSSFAWRLPHGTRSHRTPCVLYRVHARTPPRLGLHLL